MPEVMDGFISLLGGMHAGIEPSILGEAQFACGVNVSSRRGLIQTRPGWALVCDLPGTNFQGIGRWSLEGTERLVAVIDRDALLIDCDTGAVVSQALGLSDERCYFSQPHQWLLVMDGSSRPVVLQDDAGLITVSRNPTDTLPICMVPGTHNIYAHQRIHYVATLQPLLVDSDGDGIPDISSVSGNTSFVSTDVLDTLNPEYVFKMSEHMIVAQGGAQGVPLELGTITGMGLLRNAATGTGAGALIVFGREGCSAFDVGIPRTQWKDTQISQVMFTGAGTKSPWSLVSVNGDLFFLDTEGHIRSFRYTGTQTSQALHNTPLSNELSPYVSQEDIDLASMAFSDNRLLTTFQGNGTYFEALASLDFASVYSMTAQPTPAYDGFWTGYKVAQVIHARWQGQMTTFAVVYKNAGGYALLRLTTDAQTDHDGTMIESQLMTRVFTYNNLSDLKHLTKCELWLSGMTDSVEISILYRPMNWKYWYPLGSKVIQVPAGTNPQARRKIHFGLDFDSAMDDTATGLKTYAGDGFQFLIKWRGWARIDRFRTFADLEPEEVANCNVDNPDNEAVVIGEDFTLAEYEVDL